jgi:hypothetical protein
MAQKEDRVEPEDPNLVYQGHVVEELEFVVFRLLDRDLESPPYAFPDRRAATDLVGLLVCVGKTLNCAEA